VYEEAEPLNHVLGSRRSALLLIAPALLVYTAITLVPIFWSFGYTFFTGGLIGGFKFAGLHNFREFYHDPSAHAALWFTIRYAVVVTVGQVFMGYLLALLYTFYLKRSSSLVRTIVFFPVVLPTVAVALLFQQIVELSPVEGPVNWLYGAMGGNTTDFLGHSGTAFWVLVAMDVWRSMGFYGVLLYAGLVDIPDDILESARLDGAGGASLVRRIVLPLSLPVLVSSLIFSINGTLKVFDSILALTAGGPGNATTPLTLLMFKTAFSYGDYGYGSTIAFVLTLLCLVVTIFVFRSTRRGSGGVIA
jgi:multiple sugar transport system permease protein/raffinose/stachyose/melibiose transport system permease protein